MTDQEMNIAVAEVCGRHKYIESNSKFNILMRPCCDVCGKMLNAYHNLHTEFAPDYGNDLNACVEMRKQLTQEQQGDFIDFLLQNFTEEFCDLANGFDEVWAWLNVTAPQQRKAFLQAIGKYIEPPTETT